VGRIYRKVPVISDFWFEQKQEIKIFREITIMKTTCLIYKDVNADKKELRVASKQEWDEILKNNRGLSTEQRRYFIRDCIAEADELDSMFIEVEHDAYKKWHTQQVQVLRNRKEKSNYCCFSLEAPFGDDEAIGDIIHDEEDEFEKKLTEKIMFEQLRCELIKWKPWAEEMLDYYIEEKKSSCTKEMMKKYNLTRRAVAKRKEAFERKICDFYENKSSHFGSDCCGI